MIAYIAVVGMFCTFAGALYAVTRIVESALKTQQTANLRLTNLTRQLALLAKAPDVVTGQGAVEVDRNNTLLLEQESLRMKKDISTPTPDEPAKKSNVVTVGGSGFELIGSSPEEESEFLASLEKEN